LKELEKMAENFEKGEKNAACSGAEKLRKNAKARKEEAKQFDEFMAKTAEVSAQETEENEPISKPEVLEDKPSLKNPSEAEIEKNGTTRYEVNASAAALNDKEMERQRSRLQAGKKWGNGKSPSQRAKAKLSFPKLFIKKRAVTKRCALRSLANIFLRWEDRARRLWRAAPVCWLRRQ
jgi:hypothetical protein